MAGGSKETHELEAYGPARRHPRTWLKPDSPGARARPMRPWERRLQGRPAFADQAPSSEARERLARGETLSLAVWAAGSHKIRSGMVEVPAKRKAAGSPEQWESAFTRQTSNNRISGQYDRRDGSRRATACDGAERHLRWLTCGTSGDSRQRVRRWEERRELKPQLQHRSRQVSTVGG